MPDENNYPTEEELALCESIQDYDVLMLHVSNIWSYPDYVVEKLDLYEWHLSTGGWSGNEDIIGSMKKNTMFWIFCWVQSRRGGHYIFQTPHQARDERDEKDA